MKDPPQSLAPGESRDLAVRVSSKVPTGAAVTFRSSNTAVLAVDKAGRLTAVAKGKATVTVKAAGKSCAFEVRVK
ncbi:MAG: Ig-like domain-containing protein [Clostridiales Family XIII bacterium]|nr:Ig-like domain-containing protein [Clostridiales Family XIII bacterium]